jgi:site-specific DNA recombinase
MSDPPARAAIYARISQDKAGDAAGVGRQLADCRELAGRHPEWELAGEFTDNDISATSGKRREWYEQMMAAVGQGQINVIVVYTLSRLWRNRAERAAAMEKLAAVRGRVVTVKGPDLDLSTATGRMLLDLMGAFDTFEVEIKGERHQRAALEAAERGVYHGSSRPFGYQIIDTADERGRKLRTLQPDPFEADLVAEAARRVLEGDSLRSILLDWTARGIPTVRGGRWVRSTLTQILLSARNIGMREHDAGRKSGRARRGAVLYPASWPAILDLDTFEAVGEILRDQDRRVSRSNARVNLLAGFAYCGKCGQRMGGAPPAPTYKRNVRVYRCGGPPDGCGRISRGAGDIEREVERTVFHWLEDNGLYDQARAAVDSDEIRALRRRRRELSANLDRFADYLADGTWSKPTYLRQCRRIRADIADLDRQTASVVGTQFMDTVPERGNEFSGKWERAAADGARGLEWRRKVIGALIDRVVVHAAHTGRAPFDANRLQVFPGPWAAKLGDPSMAAPAPIEPLLPVSEPVRAFLAASPGSAFTVYEVARALGRDTPYSTRNQLEALVAEGAAERAGRQQRTGHGGQPKTLYQISGQAGAEVA